MRKSITSEWQSRLILLEKTSPIHVPTDRLHPRMQRTGYHSCKAAFCHVSNIKERFLLTGKFYKIQKEKKRNLSEIQPYFVPGKIIKPILLEHIWTTRHEGEGFWEESAWMS